MTNKIWFKIIYTIFLVIISISIIKNYIDKNKVDDNYALFDESDSKIKDEEDYYKFLIRKNYENQKYDSPYIPGGFKYVEGNPENGFVIEDEARNQFVWVPCTNKEIKEIPKLKRKDFTENAFVKYNECNNISYKEFLKSSLENGGFYISRYEIGKENDKPVSKENVIIWNDVTQSEAIKLSSKMYEREDIKVELINGYAYDTTLSWIKNLNDINKHVIDSTTLYTGRNKYNNIYDITDNVLELSMEESYDTSIIRGFSADDFDGLDYSWTDESRYAILQDDKELDSILDKLAFRVVLYKY